MEILKVTQFSEEPITEDIQYYIETMKKYDYQLITSMEEIPLDCINYKIGKLNHDLVRYYTLYTKGGLFTDTNTLALELNDLCDYDLVLIKDEIFLNNIILAKPNLDVFKTLYETMLKYVKANIFIDYKKLFHNEINSFIENNELNVKILKKTLGSINHYSDIDIPLPKGSWVNTSSNYFTKGNVLTAQCEDGRGSLKSNRLIVLPGVNYENIYGNIQCEPLTLFVDNKTYFSIVKIEPNLEPNPEIKKIFMTYKKDIPNKVIKRWKVLNPSYNIEFSLDSNCIQFLKKINNYLSDLFKGITTGMYKADLWRLCKLYVNGGVYADVDLVPYLNLDYLDKDVTFYSCISSVNTQSIFQAFIINHKVKSPLIYLMLLSFLLNNPQNYPNGPTFDMFNVLQYNINEPMQPFKKYILSEVKLEIKIGPSDTNEKKINLFYFPIEDYDIQLKPNPYEDMFELSIKNNILTVKRTDSDSGWGHNHSCDLIIKSSEKIYLFKERCGYNNNWASSAVYDNDIKILDSRDPEYFRNGGW